MAIITNPGVITANATTPYILGFVDLNETGPLVIELPPGPTAGGVGDFSQRAIIDMGETGPDKGKGGKYLVLPPGAKPPADADKYYIAHSPGATRQWKSQRRRLSWMQIATKCWHRWYAKAAVNR